MFNAKINFKCIMPGCNNLRDWYIMPLKLKTKNKDFINSLQKYGLQCKKCGKNYILEFTIKAV